MRTAVLIIAGFFLALSIISKASGSEYGYMAGGWAGLLIMARLVDNPPRNLFGRILLANRPRQIASAILLSVISIAVLILAPNSPIAFEWLIFAIRFVAYFVLGSAISLFVYKDARDSYAAWSRKSRTRQLRDRS